MAGEIGGSTPDDQIGTLKLLAALGVDLGVQSLDPQFPAGGIEEIEFEPSPIEGGPEEVARRSCLIGDKCRRAPQQFVEQGAFAGVGKSSERDGPPPGGLHSLV